MLFGVEVIEGGQVGDDLMARLDDLQSLFEFLFWLIDNGMEKFNHRQLLLVLDVFIVNLIHQLVTAVNGCIHQVTMLDAHFGQGAQNLCQVLKRISCGALRVVLLQGEEAMLEQLHGILGVRCGFDDMENGLGSFDIAFSFGKGVKA